MTSGHDDNETHFAGGHPSGPSCPMYVTER
jgi:hypothetical protein